MNIIPIFATFLATETLSVPIKPLLDWCAQQPTEIDSKIPISLHQPEFQDLFSAVQKQFDLVAAETLHTDVKLYEAWVNTGDNERTSLTHTHPQATIVGVYYPYVDGEVGMLELTNPVSAQEFALPAKLDAYGVFNSNVWQIEPVTGLFVMFPSWIQHVVRASAPNSSRVSIALNGRIER